MYADYVVQNGGSGWPVDDFLTVGGSQREKAVFWGLDNAM